MAPLDQVDHFITGPYRRPPFSAAAAGVHPRRPRGPVDPPGGGGVWRGCATRIAAVLRVAYAGGVGRMGTVRGRLRVRWCVVPWRGVMAHAGLTRW